MDSQFCASFPEDGTYVMLGHNWRCKVLTDYAFVGRNSSVNKRTHINFFRCVYFVFILCTYMFRSLLWSCSGGPIVEILDASEKLHKLHNKIIQRFLSTDLVEFPIIKILWNPLRLSSKYGKIRLCYSWMYLAANIPLHQLRVTVGRLGRTLQDTLKMATGVIKTCRCKK
jgi:hypothetical protein